MPNQSITKIEELFSEHELGKPVIDVDYWKLPHGNKFVMLHTAYEKLAIKANVIFTQTNWLCAGTDGMFVCEVSGYLRKDAENVQWSVGEANSVNYPAPTKGRSYYPACIAEKRGKDRVIGKLLQLSQLGIMSEMEDQAFANPEKDEQIAELQQQVKDLVGSGITRSTVDKPVGKPSGSNGNGVIDPAKLKERQAEFDALLAEAKLRFAGMTWRKEVQDNFIELYGKSHGYKEDSNPVAVLERGEIAHAYKVLLPDMVDEG